MSLRTRWHALYEWLWPSSCALCRAPAPAGRFCAACEVSLPRLALGCACCSAPLEQSVGALLCGHCQQRSPTYDIVRAPFRYSAPIDRLIQGAKYNRRLDWAAVLGARLAEHVAPHASTVDALVPVPLHVARLRQRGYNQSIELARPLAKRLGLPLLWHATRTRNTAAQAALPRAERLRNVRGAFALARMIEGQRVAIIDDVMTSGATAEALARCLRNAGAARIEVWVVARA